MGIPLVIDEEKLVDLKAFAQSHPIPLPAMKQIVAGEAPIVGDRDGYSIDFDFGYRLVFSIEEHPCGWMRHMSMSQAWPGRNPNQVAIKLICAALGFPPLDQCIVGLDGEAVSVIAEALDVRMGT